MKGQDPAFSHGSKAPRSRPDEVELHGFRAEVEWIVIKPLFLRLTKVWPRVRIETELYLVVEGLMGSSLTR